MSLSPLMDMAFGWLIISWLQCSQLEVNNPRQRGHRSKDDTQSSQLRFRLHVLQKQASNLISVQIGHRKHSFSCVFNKTQAFSNWSF